MCSVALVVRFSGSGATMSGLTQLLLRVAHHPECRAAGGRRRTWKTQCCHLLQMRVIALAIVRPLLKHVQHKTKFLNCAAQVELAIPPSPRHIGSGAFLHKWREVYAEENAFAICPDMRWPPWLHTAGGSKLVPENLRVLEARFSFCGPSSFLQMKLQTWLIGG